MARLPRYLYGGFNNPLAGPARYVVCALPHVKVVANRRPTSNRHPDFFATKRTNHPPKITPPDCLPNVDFDAKDFARAKFGTHRDFGLYTDDEANYSRVFWWYFWEVPLFAGLGALGGLCGALFVKLNVRITSLRYVLNSQIPPPCFISQLVTVVHTSRYTILTLFWQNSKRQKFVPVTHRGKRHLEGSRVGAFPNHRRRDCFTAYLVTVRTDHGRLFRPMAGDCCPYIVQYTSNTHTDYPDCLPIQD